MSSEPVVLAENPRAKLLDPFQGLRYDIDWRNVSQIPRMHEDRVIVVTGGAQGLGRDITWWTGVFGD